MRCCASCTTYTKSPKKMHNLADILDDLKEVFDFQRVMTNLSVPKVAGGLSTNTTLYNGSLIDMGPT